MHEVGGCDRHVNWSITIFVDNLLNEAVNLFELCIMGHLHRNLIYSLQKT